MSIVKNDQIVNSLEQNLSSQKVLLDAEQARSGARGIWLSFDTIELCDGNFYEASILSLFHFWLQNQNNGKWFKGFQWIYKSAADLVTGCLESLSRRKVARVLTSLVEKGLLIRDQLHFEVNDDYSWVNRTYYYRINYKAIALFVRQKYHSETENNVEDITSKQQPVELNEEVQTHITPRLVKTVQSGWSKLSNQVGQNCPIYNTKNTSTKNFQISNTLPLPPHEPTKQGERDKARVKNEEEDYWEINEKVDGVVQTEPSFVSQNEVKSSTQQDPPKLKTSSDGVVLKELKTLQKDCEGPWSSAEQRNEFYRELVVALPKVAGARVPQAMAKTILQDLEDGQPSSYWDDFIDGQPIGSSTKRPWEVNPGEVNPMFINFLVERMKRNGADTNEKAANDVFFVLNDYKQANYFWQEFKRIFVQQTAEMEKQRQLGVRHPNSPVWMRQRHEPDAEELRQASETLAIAETDLKEAKQSGLGLCPDKLLLQEAKQSGDASLRANPLGLGRGMRGQGDRNKLKAVDDRTEQKMRLPESETGPGSNLEKEYNPVPAEFADVADRLKNCLKSVPKIEAIADQKPNIKTHINQMSIEEINEALQDPIMQSHLRSQLENSDYFELFQDRHGNIESVKLSPLAGRDRELENPNL